MKALIIMKVSILFIKLIKIATCFILALAVIIPSVTFIYNKVVNKSCQVADEYFSFDYLSIKMDHFYACSISQSIISCIKKYAQTHTLFSFKTEELYKLLKKNYPVIKEFDCHVHVPKSVNIYIAGIKPYCLVNNTYILGNKNGLFSRDLFVNFNIDALPKITINHKLTNNLSDSLFNFLHQIPEEYWKKFSITYNNQSHIELIPKAAQCPCVIIVNEQNFFDEIKIKAIGNVYGDMVQKGFLSQKTFMAQDHCMTFDLRFDRRVVVKCKNDFNKRGTGL